MLGKKANFLSRAAPVVVPPLLLFSTVGAALYFASLACTDRLMRSLLPLICPELPQKVDDEDEFLEAVEETKSNQAFEEDEEKATEEEEVGKARAVEEEKPTEEKKVGKGRAMEEERTPSREVEIEEHDSSLESVDVTKSTNLSEEEEPKAEEVQVQLDAIDTTQSANGGSVFLVADVIQKEENRGAVKVFDEMLMLTEETGNGVERVVIVEGKEVSTNNEVQESSFDVASVAAMEREEGENEVIEVASFSSNFPFAVDLADGDSRSSIDHVEAATDANSVVEVETENSKPSNCEDSCSEEKLWEQLNAMRATVGYKAASSLSLADELRNLYVFTGVVPPTSLKETTNLRELNTKLRFLKSVIGVM